MVKSQLHKFLLAFLKEKESIEMPEFCYGCRWLGSSHLGDGSTQYTCGKVPGLVLATDGAFDDDQPKPIDDCYEPLGNKPINEQN